jgi:hypothetical protein
VDISRGLWISMRESSTSNPACSSMRINRLRETVTPRRKGMHPQLLNSRRTQ